MNEPRPGEFALAGDLFILPTPAGAFFAVSSTDESRVRRLLLALLTYRSSPHVDAEFLCQCLGTDDEQEALEILHRAQSLGWIEGYTEVRDVPALGVGQELHQLLPQLSSVGKGLLIDWNGLSLASCGIDEQTADTLAALGADLIGVQERHAARMAEHLGQSTHGWAAVDAYGSSRIGAWPLYIGDTRVLLVLLGEPRLNDPSFLALVWLLIENYGQPSSAAGLAARQ